MCLFQLYLIIIETKTESKCFCYFECCIVLTHPPLAGNPRAALFPLV